MRKAKRNFPEHSPKCQTVLKQHTRTTKRDVTQCKLKNTRFFVTHIFGTGRT
uniref:Uncharacterized protein n=1 Tax=Arion vulgaris TaxID=1028688 RepID=A0A0B7A6X9_9EUPU